VSQKADNDTPASALDLCKLFFGRIDQKLKKGYPDEK